MPVPELTLEVINGPKPPAFNMEGNIEALQESMAMQNEHNKQLARFQGELYNILHNGNLVRNFQVENLGANKLTAGIIAVNKIYLGDDTFELDGVLGQIRVKDDQGTPVTMIEIGKFAAGTDFGMKIRNSSGTVIFQALSTAGIFMDGVIITNATIDGVSMKANTLNDSHISALSASTINAGTLTVDGAPGILVTSTAGIKVTGLGDLTFETGGDIIMKAQIGDHSYINLQNSAGVRKAFITYDSTVGSAGMVTESSTDMIIDGGASDVAVYGATIFLGNASTQDLTPVADFIGNITPDVDGTLAVGVSGRKFSLVRATTITSGDLEFENGMVFTEPNKVISTADPKDGVMLMNQNWEIVSWEHLNGTRQTSGFPSVDVPRHKPPQFEISHDLLEEFDDEIGIATNGLTSHGRIMLSREIHNWVVNARDNGIILDDVDVEEKKIEIMVNYNQGKYNHAPAKDANTQHKLAKLEKRRIEREERKERRKKAKRRRDLN